MNKPLIGVLFGAAAGLIDIIPMVMMKLPVSADLSAFSLWVVTGLLIAVSELKFNSAVKGLVVALLVFLPNAFLIGQNNIADLLPPLIMTIILGSLLGFLIDHKGENNVRKKAF
jgi:hypothetical protein